MPDNAGAIPAPTTQYNSVLINYTAREKENKIMARTPMVTRTIVTTKATVMCLDVEKGEPFNETYILPRTYKDEKALMKKVKQMFETDTIKPVHVVDVTEVETLYGMTEQDFILNAEILPAREEKVQSK